MPPRTPKSVLGRRPVDDKRKAIRIFPQQSRIDALGGDIPLKLKLAAYIEREYKKTLKK